MSVRFRIRTSQGQELSFASAEIFVEFIRSGDLSPDDLVYDGESHEWAPARVHPLVLEIEYEREESAGREPGSESGDAKSVPAGGSDVDSGSDAAAEEGVAAQEPASRAFGLELAPPVEPPSPEEERAAFLRRMEAERAMERDTYAESSGGLAGFRMEDAATLGEMIYSPSEPEAPRPRRESATGAELPTGGSKRPRQKGGPQERSQPRPRGPKGTAGAARGRGKGSAFKKVAFFLLLAGAVGVGAYFALGRVAGAEVADPLDPIDGAEAEPVPPLPIADRVIRDTEEALRERALERFLTTTRDLLGSLEPIPESWLRGEYFVRPSDHAHVRAVWKGYLDLARRVRTGGRERYRAAYERALDDVGARGEARDARIQRALDRFDTTAEDRAAHWDRVEALADAAIDSHDALLKAEGLVLYDASGATGRPSGIGAGTSGRDSDAQLLLDQVIDLLTRVLAADGKGPREGADVREWVWGGYLDAVTG